MYPHSHFKQKTAYEMRESDWSSDVCSSDLKYILQYTVTTVGTNIWDQATKKRVEYTMSSGVVLNNTNSSTPVSYTHLY